MDRPRQSGAGFGMWRVAKAPVSEASQAVLSVYADALQRQHVLRPATHRNYLSDSREFAAWCERAQREAGEAAFAPAHLTMPTLTAYRRHLQALGLSPATINRHLVGLKRYTAWTHEQRLVGMDPGKPVKPVPCVPPPSQQLSDREEAALVTAVTAHGMPRDRALVATALHTGLRAEELCGLRRADVTVTTRSGVVSVYGYRMAKSVPLHRLAPLMGHDSLDTTRIYVASTRQRLQEAVETIAWA